MGERLPVRHIYVNVDGMKPLTMVTLFPSSAQILLNAGVGLNEHPTIVVIFEQDVGFQEVFKEGVDSRTETRYLSYSNFMRNCTIFKQEK